MVMGVESAVDKLDPWLCAWVDGVWMARNRDTVESNEYRVTTVSIRETARLIDPIH